MIFQILFLFVVTAVADGCNKTAYKRLGESCKCSDACLDNTYCLKDGSSGLACLCLPCQYYDSNLQQCIDFPGEGDTCTTLCTAPYVCASNTRGGSSCQSCPSNQYYDANTVGCIKNPTYGEQCTTVCDCNLQCQADASTGRSTCGCSADSAGWDPVQKRCRQDCYSTNVNSCKCAPNGDYQPCYPLCQDGVYISCSNSTYYLRDCGLAWYVRSDGTRFTAKMVYNPTMGSCQRSASYCPRALDAQVER